MYYELQLKIIKILHDNYLYQVRRHVYNKIIEIMIQPYIFSDHKNKQLERQYDHIINRYPELRTHLNKEEIFELVQLGYQYCQEEYL
jgi:hypothetical protein